jgi:hypothetical protein
VLHLGYACNCVRTASMAALLYFVALAARFDRSNDG